MTRAADIRRALAEELARPNAPGSPKVRERIAEALADSLDVAAVWSDLLTAAGRILTPEQRRAGTDREITPAGLLLTILARLAEVDPFTTPDPTESPQGWYSGERRDPQRLAAWLATPDRLRRTRLDRVARLARQLAEALTDCAGTDAAAELVAGWAPGPFCSAEDIERAERFAQGDELPRRLRELADHAAGLKLRPATVERPNRDTARRTWWLRQIAARIATPETCDGMTEARRRELVSALSGAILNETVTPDNVYNSLK